MGFVCLSVCLRNFPGTQRSLSHFGVWMYTKEGSAEQGIVITFTVFSVFFSLGWADPHVSGTCRDSLPDSGLRLVPLWVGMLGLGGHGGGNSISIDKPDLFSMFNFLSPFLLITVFFRV